MVPPAAFSAVQVNGDAIGGRMSACLRMRPCGAPRLTVVVSVEKSASVVALPSIEMLVPSI